MGFFDQLLKNPHGWGSLPPHPKEIAFEDDAGNGYGFDGGIVKKGTYNTPMTLGETALATATAPAKIATGLASTLSPYGSEGWQVPPIISEPIAAGNRLLNSGGFPDPQDPQNQQDAVTSLLAFFGANAFNPARMAKGAAAGAVAKTEPKFRLQFGPWGEDFGETAYLNGTSLRYGPSGIDPNAAYIKSLVTPNAEAGRGQARALMSDLTRQADAEGVPLVLDAQAWDTGTDVNRLRKFYSGLGFEDVDGAGMMRREPSFLSDTKPSILGSILAAENANHKGALASNAVRSAADSLPMDQASRLARAKEMGFDTDRVLYHGTRADGLFDDLRPSPYGSLGEGVYLTKDVGIANSYAVPTGKVYPTYARGKMMPWEEYMDIPRSLPGETLTQTRERFLNEVSSRGYAGVQFDNYGTVAINDPSNIRSVNAAFDPARAGENGLMLSDTSRPSLLGSAIAAEQSKTPGITAYHGSPHDFDKFDISKIGTGEGAQAYGHGLYFAENEGVARSYRDNLTERHWSTPSGMAIPESNLDSVLGDITDTPGFSKVLDMISISRGGSIDAARKEILSGKTYGFGKNRLLSVLNAIERAGLEQADEAGHMYQVKINANPEDFLDWDKPLSQQSEAVQTVVKSDPMFGLEMYQEAPDNFMRNLLRDTDTTRRLSEAGIPGVRYLDGNSRGVGEGSSNYVVFDDNLIEILKKYGIIPGLYGASQMGDKRE